MLRLKLPESTKKGKVFYNVKERLTYYINMIKSASSTKDETLKKGNEESTLKLYKRGERYNGTVCPNFKL